ncbi:nucleoredoxin-like [Penaeus chinensis]|uniref:nucleoredoxin-like n=1 Tax=Penaeus chinensis TaxID=139456 RepID=UPI001FB5721D|nr:nucleoredoxin-like [Penaeus chinensis]
MISNAEGRRGEKVALEGRLEPPLLGTRSPLLEVDAMLVLLCVWESVFVGESVEVEGYTIPTLDTPHLHTTLTLPTPKTGRPCPPPPASVTRRVLTPSLPLLQVRLSRQYRVSAIPSLVLLDSRSGRVITKSGREMVSSDPEALTFPWRPRALGDLLAATSLVDPQGQVVTYDAIKDAYKGLYFSAHWCPPCKAFTPQLISVYEKIKKKEGNFQMIFVSSDRSEESWRAYHSTMPWLSVAWECEDVRRELATNLEVQGIPTFVVLAPDNTVITAEGRAELTEDPEAERFPWRPQSVEVLAERHMARLQESPCLVLFTDGETTELQFGRDVLLPVAEEYLLEHAQEGALTLQFFVAGEDEVSDSVRDFACLEDVVPLVAILDLAEGAKFLLEDGVEVSTATVHNFVTRYCNSKLSPLPIRPVASSATNTS